MNVAMAALEATIHIRGPKGERSVPIGDFHLLPGNTPNRETVLEPGDLITHVTLPPPSPGNRSLYLKLCVTALHSNSRSRPLQSSSRRDGGKITRARVALGGVGTKPWRSPGSGSRTNRAVSDPSCFSKAAEAALRDAKPQSQNGFKVELAKRCLDARSANW